MDIIHSSITAFVQGLTEFLPISSSGHLVLFSSLYKVFTGQDVNVTGQEEIFFDIMLHVGTLIAVIIYFRNDLLKLLKGLITSIQDKSFLKNEDTQTIFNVGLATFATAAVALPLQDVFKSAMGNPAKVGLHIIITGLLLFSTEFISKRRKQTIQSTNNLPKICWKRALFMGLAQGLAVSPGISRSGSTIAAGLLSGLDRVSCAKFSFIMSIPIIILGALSDAIHLGFDDLAKFNWISIIFGTILAAIVGYYCIKYFIIYLSKNNLNIFAYYCIIVGTLMFFGFSALK